MIDSELPTLKNGFLWSCFLKISLIDFRKATNLVTGLPKNYSWNILFIDSKISSTKIIHLKNTLILKSFGSNISCYRLEIHKYIHTYTLIYTVEWGELGQLSEKVAFSKKKYLGWVLRIYVENRFWVVTLRCQMQQFAVKSWFWVF